MENSQLSQLTNYIRDIADGILRDFYVHGKYRDVGQPTTIMRRLDAVLEDREQAGLGMEASLDKAKIVEQGIAVRLMISLMFLSAADTTESRTYLQYDCNCGTGGMLTAAEDTLLQIGADDGKRLGSYPYCERNIPKIHAICRADIPLKSAGDYLENTVGGLEHTILSDIAVCGCEFDSMLSDPPHGKSWKNDLLVLERKTEGFPGEIIREVH